MIAWLPVVTDPLIYMLTHEKYRKAFKMLFTNAYNYIAKHDQAMFYVKGTKEDGVTTGLLSWFLRPTMIRPSQHQPSDQHLKFC